MLRLLIFFAAVAAIAGGLAWLADRPGNLIIDWEGRRIEMEVYWAVIGLLALIASAIAIWSTIRGAIKTPTVVADMFKRRAQRRGLEALSTGMIAIGAGDRDLADRYAHQARKALPNEPLTELLRAQTAQLTGDHAGARRIYEAMLSAPDTEVLGLRGLFLEAKKECEGEAARQFAERAMKINPQLDWPVAALFDLQCRAGDWSNALATVRVAKKNGHIDAKTANRRRAVLLAAESQDQETSDIDAALEAALEAHRLAPDLVAAAAVAGRILASRGSTGKAASVIKKTWRVKPHPDLATAYAFARPGDSTRDRLSRVTDLASLTPHNVEGPVAVATVALEARDWDAARGALEALLEKQPSQRVCALMARLEGGEKGNRGSVREWLARAVHAPLDPAWTADGVVSDAWEPVSPATGEFDVFEWKVPPESRSKGSAAQLLEELTRPIALGDGPAKSNGAGAAAHAASDEPETVIAEPVTQVSVPAQVKAGE